jgi:hypothetical protein
MHKPTALLSLLLLHCGPSSVKVDDAARLLLHRLQGGEDVTALLTPSSALHDERGVTSGAAPIAAALSGLRVPADGLIDAHHDSAALPLADHSLLIAEADGSGHVVSVLRFPPVGAAEAAASTALAAYQRAWNSTGPERTTSIQTAWADGARYVDPQAEGVGVNGLVKVIDDFQRRFVGATVDPVGGVQALAGGRFAFRWVIRSGDSTLEGFDVGTLERDGRLARITGFFSKR